MCRSRNWPDLVVRRGTLQLTLPPGDYGSCCIEQLGVVSLWMRVVTRVRNVSRVVVDLRQVRYFGAALLGILAGAVTKLNRQGVSLEVVGDHHRLVTLVGLSSRIRVLDDQDHHDDDDDDALNP